jgi:cell wall-associated NlpC family hydrolase
MSDMPRIQYRMILAALAVCLGAGFPTASPAQGYEALGSGNRLQGDRDRGHTLTRDDGLAVVETALDEHIRMRGKRDCSHLVHTIYDRAGFSYTYASSRDLYRGTGDFRRVRKPQPGDLVVWRGHVGIVVNPAQREFYSFLRHGPGIDEYDTQYWKQRGPVRFYRYIKSNLPEDDQAER